MSLLILEDVKKHYGAQEVLRGATLQIDPGAKVGLVGRNGGGKTTLLRMIAGEETPDWGTIILRRGTRVGTVPQRPEFAPGLTVRAWVELGLADARDVLARLEAVGEAMADASPQELERLMAEHERLSTRVEELGGWETERRVETVLSGIGLVPELWEREARTLSGGEKSRTALARELVGGHDMLLLDEPTNHLDLDGIEWIERYIHDLPGAVLVVSHDRRLLRNAVDAILELEFGRLTRYAGNYDRYLQQKEERYESDMRAWQVQQDFIRREEAFIKKHMGSQRTSEAKGRQKKLRGLERLERPSHDVRRPAISAPKAARGGELVVEAEDLAGGYGDKVLFRDASVRIGRGHRVGIVGPNGAGKSTLLRILTGALAPLAGKVRTGHQAACAYYDQDTSGLRADGTPLSELQREWPELTDLDARSHLARFLFRGNDVEKPVPALSGGERARLCLAKLVLAKPSWMALDEPTNHLDLASRTALEEMLGEFQGALVCISHDREFLDGLCELTIEVADGAVREFRGNYSAWRRAKEQEAADAAAERERKAEGERRREREAREREAARAKPADAKAKPKARNPWRFERLEKRIIELEEALQGLHADCAREEVYRDPERLRETQIRIAELEHELALANEEWESWA